MFHKSWQAIYIRLLAPPYHFRFTNLTSDPYLDTFACGASPLSGLIAYCLRELSSPACLVWRIYVRLGNIRIRIIGSCTFTGVHIPALPPTCSCIISSLLSYSFCRCCVLSGHLLTLTLLQDSWAGTGYGHSFI